MEKVSESRQDFMCDVVEEDATEEQRVVFVVERVVFAAVAGRRTRGFGHGTLVTVTVLLAIVGGQRVAIDLAFEAFAFGIDNVVEGVGEVLQVEAIFEVAQGQLDDF